MADYTVLVLDYEPRGICQLRDPLQGAGYNVVVVKDGVTGIKLFEELKPDLTLIEAMLPKKHGFEVCQELKKTAHGANSPIVIVTSVYKGRKYRTQAIHNFGCDEYLEKPVPAQLLLDTVSKLIADREAAGPAPEPPAETEPAPAEAKPEKLDPADVAPAPEPATADDGAVTEAEAEIMERLDEILGDGPKASSGVVPFDAGRARSAVAPGESPSVGAPPEPRGTVQLGRIEGQTIRQPEPRVDHAPRSHARPRTRHSPPPPTTRGPWVWIATMLAVLAAAAALLWWLRPF